MSTYSALSRGDLELSEEERAGLDVRLEQRSYWYEPEVYIGLLAVSLVGAVLTAIYLWSVR